MKIGIVGHGSIGSRHAENARALGHDVKAYDPGMMARDFRYERDLYDWCDAAVIANPSAFHEGPLRACIERGKHALVEKPISLSVGALPKLLKAADEKKLVVMMGNNLRFHPCVRFAKEKIECAAIKPLWASFICAGEASPNNARDGVIANTGAHEIDVALHLFGPVQYVAGACARYSMYPTEDVADFTLVHDNNIRSTFHLDFITEARLRQFRISGGDCHFTAQLDTRISTLKAECMVSKGSYDDDYLLEMRAFIDRIEGSTTLGAGGEEGLETLRVIEAVRKKAQFA